MTTGRPRDEFAWRHVNKIDGKLECKFCGKVFAGATSRIITHLSGKGRKDIQECPSVPMEIKEEALNRRDTASKRKHKNYPSASTSNTHVSITKKATDEHVTDAFMKLLMLDNCSSSAVTDFMKSSHLREFLERASEYGVPSGLLAGDSEVVRKSMFNITEEVYRHTLMLKESWKTTGCTLMVFKGIFPSHDQEMCLFGFYCPKGIVFVEAPDPDLNFTDFQNALERHKPSFDLDPATTSYVNVVLRHSHQGSDDWARYYCNAESRRCLRDEVEEICIDVCRESAWAESLLNRAVEIHEHICCHWFLRQGYYEILQKNVRNSNDFDNIKGLPAFRLSVFLSLMRRSYELSKYINKRKSLGEDVAESLEAIVHDLNDIRCTFYVEGWKLMLVLTCTLKFSECMDTLVPTSGYLAMAIQQLEDRLRLGIIKPVVIEGEDSFTFWKELKSRLTGIIQGSSSREAASYMNPHYFLHKDVQKDPQLPQKVSKALTKALNLYGDEYDSADEDDEDPNIHGKLLKEVRCYRDVFSNKMPLSSKLRDYHPAKLWEEHGHELPNLRKHAIVLLSQPLNCMCKQLKKHMYQLQGAEDYILRLNVRMMQEFKLLGDDICKPPDFSLYGFMC